VLAYAQASGSWSLCFRCIFYFCILLFLFNSWSYRFRFFSCGVWHSFFAYPDVCS
jgi:hypothetical protein